MEKKFIIPLEITLSYDESRTTETEVRLNAISRALSPHPYTIEEGISLKGREALDLAEVENLTKVEEALYNEVEERLREDIRQFHKGEDTILLRAPKGVAIIREPFYVYIKGVQLTSSGFIRLIFDDWKENLACAASDVARIEDLINICRAVESLQY